MKFSIGEFSRMTSLSIKSLRMYHEKDILIPFEVDGVTGYRYYNEANFETARAIKILRSFDFSLADIKSILDESTDESDLLSQFENKLSDVREKIHQFQQISRSMELLIQTEKEYAMKANQQFEVEEKTVETILIAGHRMKGRYDEVGGWFWFNR